MKQKITVTVFIKPIFYKNSEIFSNTNLVSEDDLKRKNALKFEENDPLCISAIKGSMDCPGEVLEHPIKFEYENGFLSNTFDLVIKNMGFRTLVFKQRVDKKKAECRYVFGFDDMPCGTLVFRFLVSMDALDRYKLPKAWKDATLDCLQMNKIFADDFRQYGIDFMIDKAVVGKATYDSWDRAITPLWNSFKKLRRNVLKRRKPQKKGRKTV